MNTNNLIKPFLLLSISSLLLVSCKDESNTSDAFGNFDVDETIISAEAAGKLTSFSILEGQFLKAGQIVGNIDSTNLVLQRNEIEANRSSISAKLTAINAEINV